MVHLQALGSNGSGQLGIGHKEDVSSPETVLLPPSLTSTDTPSPKLLHIAAGGNHTMLLFDSGDLLWSGDHTEGAFGPVASLDNEDVEQPPRFRPVALPPSILANSKVTHVTATWTATIFATTTTTTPTTTTPKTTLYALGTGLKGELGLGPRTTTIHEPTPIPNFPPPNTHLTSLASCMGHTVAVLNTGEVWGWGNGRKGQLGEPSAAAVYSPRRIEGIQFPVVKVVCGREFTVLFGGPETGEMVVLGSDKWGVRSGAPSRETVRGWKDVGAGWGGVVVLTRDGGLVAWGRDDHGQLGSEENRERLGGVERIAVGSEHALALTEQGDVVVWGWGEHGNCGEIRKVEGEKGERNKIAAREEGRGIAMIGAGCATSWIAVEKQT
ncbi:regulator of chromosome condensation 1/beta-lactamase-inhibitor protein II [Chaetomium sp. MPI-SDFR-AT-0129]|nr:regulator of chromosome condensation 1/beta-lactamase-inhibitor protein II [Chaetomium sp. MPI-SDFR-AT-0129]